MCTGTAALRQELRDLDLGGDWGNCKRCLQRVAEILSFKSCEMGCRQLTVCFLARIRYQEHVVIPPPSEEQVALLGEDTGGLNLQLQVG